jgi:hypothetical protein
VIDVHDAAVLIKHVPPPGRDVVSWLAGHPGRGYSYDQIAHRLGLADEAGIDPLADSVARAIWLIGEFCEAFRMEPLITVDGDVCSMDGDDARVVTAALARLDEYQS